MTRAQRQVDNIGDSVDNDRRTFFQEPGWNRIRIIRLLELLNKILGGY